MKDDIEMAKYGFHEAAYAFEPVTKRTYSELLDSDRNICNYNDQNFGFPAHLSRRSTVQTLNYFPEDQIKEDMPEPELTYSGQDTESIDEFDAITSQCPSRRQSSTSINFEYY